MRNDINNEPFTEKQIKRLLNSTGKWFFIKYFEDVYSNRENKEHLIKRLYCEGFDKDITGTSTRVNCMIRLINSDCLADALQIIADSKRLCKDHPDLKMRLDSIYSRHPEFR